MHGRDRAEALTRLREALAEYQVIGPSTNIEFLKSVASHPDFAAGPVETSFVPEHHDELFAQTPVKPEILAQAALFITARNRLPLELSTIARADPWGKLLNRRFGDVSEQTITLDKETIKIRHPSADQYEVSVGSFTAPVTALVLSPTEMITHFPSGPSRASFIPQGNKLHVFHEGRQYTFTQPASLAAEGGGSATAAADSLTSPMPATVIEVRVKEGEEVKAGQVCAVLESMKMEINIRAGRDGKIGKVNVNKGQTVEEGAVLVALESAEPTP